MTATVRVAMLPAAHGDCLWLEYGVGDERARILIDAGPSHAFDHVVGRLRELADDDPLVDVFVITHVDTDHIEGALRLIGGVDSPLMFGDVWFNGLGHLEADRVGTDRGGVQGQFLAALLAGRAWNLAWGGKAVRLTDDGAPITLRPPAIDGRPVETITVLSPTRAKARSMAKQWRLACEGADLEIDDVAQVLARFEADARYGAQRGGDEARVVRLGVDGSVPNGSSIAFVFEYGGRCVLLSGDAHAGVLRDSIRRLLDQRGDARLHLDAFKISHHGSRNNISAALLDLLVCDTFLVSTNGDRFGHPDAEAIELIASRAGGSRTRVVFNYRTEHTSPWEHDPRIEAIYGDDGFVLVEL